MGAVRRKGGKCETVGFFGDDGGRGWWRIGFGFGFRGHDEILSKKTCTIVCKVLTKPR